MNNIDSYDVMSKYYKFIYNHQISNNKDVINYLKFLTSNLNNKEKYLDIGCGTGIFTEKLCNHFDIIYGIDPCKNMILNAKKNKKIKYLNIYLQDLNEDKFDLISAFSQVINHITTFEEITNFIKLSSKKLKDDGIFYIDVFNSTYFKSNTPQKLKRKLNENVYYHVNPTKFKRFSDHTLMTLNNHISDNKKIYNYNLDIYIWNIELILHICQIHDLVLISNTKMLSLKKGEEYHKISLIFKKKKRIDLVANKKINFNNVQLLLNKSFELKSLTNYGPNVRYLETLIKEKYLIDDDKVVIVTNNGSSALQTLALGIQKYHNNLNEWTTQSFTFFSAHQGSLKNSYIIDIDNEYFLDLNLVNDKTIGIIVTNIFGNICDINKYVKWCKLHNKLLIFDNAATPYTFYNKKNSLNFGVGSIISFHHTKGLGFGEGGAIIVDKKYELIIRELINFKKHKNNFDSDGNNFKMSDINACYIIDYLSSMSSIISHTKNLYNYFKKKSVLLKDFKFFSKNYDEDNIYTSLICLIYKSDSNLFIKKLNEDNIFCKKYYKPLNNSIIANNLYDRIICIPLHIDMCYDDIDRVIKILLN